MKNMKFNISANSKLNWLTLFYFLEQELKASRKKKSKKIKIKLEDICSHLETVLKAKLSINISSKVLLWRLFTRGMDFKISFISTWSHWSWAPIMCLEFIQWYPEYCFALHNVTHTFSKFDHKAKTFGIL